MGLLGEYGWVDSKKGERRELQTERVLRLVVFDAHDGRAGHARDNKGGRSFVGWNEGEKQGCETKKVLRLLLYLG